MFSDPNPNPKPNPNPNPNPYPNLVFYQNSLQRMATNQSSVGADLLAALSQFFELFPEQRANPFYVTGESYAGKYVPACAYAIHARNAQQPPSKRINLQGISIGDGAFAPEVQLSGGFGDLLYNVGMVSHDERAVFRGYEARMDARVDACMRGCTPHAWMRGCVDAWMHAPCVGAWMRGYGGVTCASLHL